MYHRSFCGTSGAGTGTGITTHDITVDATVCALYSVGNYKDLKSGAGDWDRPDSVQWEVS